MLHRECIEDTGFSFAKSIPVDPERRHGQRHMTILRVGTLIADGRRELCLIRNISAGGLMAHVYSTVKIGQRVTIELKTNQQLAGKVVWIREANIGIEFEAPIDVADLLSSPGELENGWRARMPRIEIDRAAAVRSGSTTHWVTVRDISLGGLKAETDQPLEEKSDVVVSLDNFRPLPGIVRWSRHGHCGITFNEVIPFSELIQWLKRDG